MSRPLHARAQPEQPQARAVQRQQVPRPHTLHSHSSARRVGARVVLRVAAVGKLTFVTRSQPDLSASGVSGRQQQNDDDRGMQQRGSRRRRDDVDSEICSSEKIVQSITPFVEKNINNHDHNHDHDNYHHNDHQYHEIEWHFEFNSLIQPVSQLFCSVAKEFPMKLSSTLA